MSACMRGKGRVWQHLFSHSSLRLCKGIVIAQTLLSLVQTLAHALIFYLKGLGTRLILVYWIFWHCAYVLAGELLHLFVSSTQSDSPLSALTYHPSLHLLAASSLTPHHPISLISHSQWHLTTIPTPFLFTTPSHYLTLHTRQHPHFIKMIILILELCMKPDTVMLACSGFKVWPW